MSKFIKILSYIVLGLSGLYFIYMMIISGNITLDKWNSSPTAIEFLSLDLFLLWASILTVCATLLTLVFSIINAIKNPKNLKKLLISLVLLVVIVVVSFVIATPYVKEGLLAQVKPDEMPSDSIKRWIETGLFMTYALTLVAILTIVAGGIMNFIKNR